MHSDTDEELLKYYIAKRQVLEPIKSGLYKLLLELINERLSEDAISDKLDPEILPLLVEESYKLSEDNIQELFDETLVQKQALKDGHTTDRLKTLIFNAAKNISDNTDNELISIFNSTGLSRTSCLNIKSKIMENEEYYKKLLKHSNISNCEEILETFLEIAEDIKEMNIEEVDFYYVDLLIQWLSGAHIEDIIETFSNSDFQVEDLINFIEEYFVYRIPWGITGFIRIAEMILDIEDEVSIFCKFLPSMIKYGVPNPESSWVMSVGIPSREVAIEIALEYLKETIDINYHNFIE